MIHDTGGDSTGFGHRGFIRMKDGDIMGQHMKCMGTQIQPLLVFGCLVGDEQVGKIHENSSLCSGGGTDFLDIIAYYPVIWNS